MSIPVSTPTIKEFPFQIFVYGKFTEREGHRDLTEMQKNVRFAMRKWGNQADAARALGISTQCIQGHVSLIISKGWPLGID